MDVVAIMMIWVKNIPFPRNLIKNGTFLCWLGFNDLSMFPVPEIGLSFLEKGREKEEKSIS